MSVVTNADQASEPAVQINTTELAITGMTCASCAARIEKGLSKLDGVHATVNFATENARVTYPASVGTSHLISAIEQAGYTATVARSEADSIADGPSPDDDTCNSSNLI